MAENKQKKTGGAGQTKRPAQKKNTDSKQIHFKDGINKQKLAIILAGVAAILFFVAVIPGENIWNTCHQALYGIFGVCAFIIPILLVYLVVVFSKDESTGGISGNLIGIGVVSFIIATAAHIFSNKEEYLSVTSVAQQIANAYQLHSLKSGGAIGAILGSVMVRALGKTGSVLIVIVLLITSVLLFTGISLPVFISALAKPVKKVSRASAENARKIEELRERKRAEKEQSEAEKDEESGNMPPIIDNSGARRMSVPSVDIDYTPSGDLIEPEMPKTSGNKTASKVVGMPAGVDGVPGVSSMGQDVTAPIDAGVSDGITDAPEEKKSRRVRTPKIKVVKEEKPEEKPESNVVKFDDGSITAPKKDYEFPSIECLEKPTVSKNIDATAEMQMGAKKLVSTLESFRIKVEVTGIVRGPSVTRYELLPEAGVRISKITSLADDIALRLAAQSVRIEAPIPGKSAIGIEIPNSAKSMVRMREIIDTDTYRAGALKSKLNVALGKDITGNIITADLTKMPHLLVAGTTGSGKSVCMNAMIISILYNASPDDVRLLMIDPKQVEFVVYNGIAHLEVPVVTEARKAAGALSWAVSEMEKRYHMFSENSVRDIKGYNKLAAGRDDMEKMHHIVIFIDELSDLMMAAPKEVEDSICRLAQMARAAGIHLVIATQSPRADIITGLIKANIPSRIALKVSSPMESRIIFDQSGAEKLLGNGDLLFNPVGTSKPTRVQGCYISDEEVEAVVNHIKKQGQADYNDETMREIDAKAAATAGGSGDDEEISDLDPMFNQAVETVLMAQQASTTMLQKKLKLGYARASRVIDQLEEQGIVGPANGAKPREILITKQMWYEKQALAGGTTTTAMPDGQLQFSDEVPEEEAVEDDDFFAAGMDDEDAGEDVPFISFDEENEPADDENEIEFVELEEQDEEELEEDEIEEEPEEDEPEEEASDEPEMLDDSQFFEEEFDDFEDDEPVNIDDVFADDEDYSGN